MKWETKEPRYSLLLVSSRAAKLYDPESKRLEVYPLSSGLAAIIGTPLPRFLRLKESFSIERAEPGKESEQVVLTLTPLNEELAEHIESITVWIDPKIPAATALEMVDPDGERTRITFSKIELDQGLSEEDFELELPDDVLIEYPMGPIPENGGP
ncbi:MAG: outer membrane lipoprotein carrier protein LolA [Planctomycetes bacterium]|nr:outer membrane lipoprotein carrier protein LolA [Planctomycetota bacterium]